MEINKPVHVGEYLEKEAKSISFFEDALWAFQQDLVI